MNYFLCLSVPSWAYSEVGLDLWFADGGLGSLGCLGGRGGLEKCQGMGLWEVPL